MFYNRFTKIINKGKDDHTVWFKIMKSEHNDDNDFDMNINDNNEEKMRMN